VCAVAVAALLTGQRASLARSGEDAASASGAAEIQPWSGWWWPAGDSVGPTLFASDGPLDKYDRYMAATGSDNPGTRAWERQELYVPGVAWAGHCNGFAAAALLEPEPAEPVTVLGITFSVADLKGLLVDYHFGDAAAWSFGADGQLNPADFHRMLLTWLGETNHGFVLTYDMGNGEVWSYPAYRFDSHWTPEADHEGVWHVTTTVWMADMDVSPNFVGTKPYPSVAGKTFEYTLQGDPMNPDDGAWSGPNRAGRFAHPGRIWYPEPTVRNADRDLVSPGLDRQTIANILAGSDGSDITPSPGPTAMLAAATPAAVGNATPAPVGNATPTPVGNATPTPVGNATPTPVGNATPTPKATSSPTSTLTPTLTVTATARITPTKVPPRP
jgi:hypothetical protein